jgi:copper transport protein
VQAWLATGESSSFSTVKDFVSDSRYGEIWIARMLLAAGAVVCSLLILARSGGEWHESILHPKNTPWIILSALAIALPVTTSLNSHAAGGGDFNFSTGIDYVHLVAGGLWLGLLVQFGLVILMVVPQLDERAGFLAGSVRRFSWIAVPTVAVIVVTGLIQSIDRLGGIDELFDSDYGLTLLMKILLIAPVVAIGAFNVFLFGPKFVAYARERARALLQMRPWERAFRLGIIVEVALAVVILGVTALLTSTSPQGSAQEDGSGGQTTNPVPTPTAESDFVLVDDLSISVWADPGMPGVNQVNALVIDQEGDEDPIQRVLFRFKYLGDDLGVSEAEAQALHPPSHWVADTTDLSLPGEWEVEVIVRREGMLDARGTVQLDIGA